LTTASEYGTIRPLTRTAFCKFRMIEPNDFYLRLGDLIRRRREQLRLTQAELGETLGLSRTSVTNIERGRQRLLVDQFHSVCRALDVPPSLLLSDVGAGTANPVDTPRPELEKMPTVAAFVKRTLMRANSR
jgi:transcriptional regulator with XRE-family HTH domain